MMNGGQDLANVAEDRFHERFNDPDADIVLRSSDGVLFRAHISILRRTSAFFGTMFSLPAPAEATAPSPALILDEASTLILTALQMIYGFAFPHDLVCGAHFSSHNTSQCLPNMRW